MIALITGARTLAANDAARAWLRGRLDALAPTIIHAGDATGPDAWALEFAAERGTPWRRWSLNGFCYYPRSAPLPWGTRGKTPARRWPLERNRRMVEQVATVDSGAIVLALRDPSSRTQGTAHTIGLARRAGLTVEEWTP